MPFVKLDCGILDSTLWPDRPARELFVTALLMAKPHQVCRPEKVIEVRSTDFTGATIPAGWYGFVPASGTGIIRRAGLELEQGMEALERLCDTDPESRTPEFEGRRMARVDGGYLVLNFDKYRNKDHTGAERARRYRESRAARDGRTVTSRVTKRDVTQAEAEAEAEATEGSTPQTPPSAAPPRRAGGISEGAKSDRLPTTDQSKRIATIFHRKLTTPWSTREVKAYRAIGTVPEDDLAAVEAYYSAHWPPNRELNILRHDLLTFLNNFPGEVDRARNFKAHPTTPNASTTKNSAAARTANDRDRDRTGFEPAPIPTRLL